MCLNKSSLFFVLANHITLNNLKLNTNPAMVINKNMIANKQYPILKNQCLILVKNITFLADFLGIRLKALSKIKNNKLQIKPAKLGIRYTSSLKYPISNKDAQNIPRENSPTSITIGLSQLSLEEIDARVSSITI
jgi:hypothetical protein